MSYASDISREFHKLIKDTLTLSDGKTYCMGRVLAFVSSGNALFLSVLSTVKPEFKFDMLAYGAGVAALATGIGALLKIKASTEPDAPRPASFISEKVTTPGESVSVTTAMAAGGHQ